MKTASQINNSIFSPVTFKCPDDKIVGSVPFDQLSRFRRFSDFSLNGCYLGCTANFPFSKEKREACRAKCDEQATALNQQAAAQAEALQNLQNQETSGMSTMALFGIAAGIIVVTIGGIILIRRYKLKKK